MNIKSKKGFTIIEIVLVLAIAGLIFLMVFVGLPALQRSQRDAQRKQDMERLINAIRQYQVNNNGSIPGSGKYNSSFIRDYITKNGDTFKDPSGKDYEFKHGVNCETNKGCGTAAGSLKDTHFIYVYRYASCDKEKPEYPKWEQGKQNSVAIVIKLEGGGYYCANN